MLRLARSIFATCMLLPTLASATPQQRTAPFQAGSAAVLDFRYDDATLAELARDAQQHGGIAITVPGAFRADTLKRAAHAATWADGLKELLQGYNYVSVYGPNGTLERIIIQGRQDLSGKPRPAGSGAPPERPAPLFVEEPAVATRALPRALSGLNPHAVKPIKLSVERLGHMKSGDVISVRLGDHPYKLVHDHAQRHDNDDRTWIGYLDLRGQAFRGVLTYRADGAITGQINTPRGMFEIVQFEGKTWVIDLKASGLGAGSLEHDQQLRTSTAKGAPGILQAEAATARARATVDLLVLHTRADDAQAALRANHLVAVTQQALTDSGAFVDLRLVRVERVDYTDNNANLSALEDLTHNRVGADVAALRRRVGADLVVLLRRFHSSAQGSCGVSWVGGSNQQALTMDLGFSVVSDGFDDRYYCHEYTFAHEVGHIFGNVHDPDISPPGAFPFSYAWAVPGKFATIMSYQFDVAPLVGKFANPAIACSAQGLPCGRAGLADNTRTINLTARTIANFVPTAAE